MMSGDELAQRCLLHGYGAEYGVELGGDDIDRMNCAQMLADHVDHHKRSGRQCAVAGIEVPRDGARAFGVIGVDEHWHVTGTVNRSVPFSGARVHSPAILDWSVLLPEVQVGRHVRLHRVDVDRGCTLPDGLVIGEDAEADAARFFRTDGGITLVTADMLAALGY
ncbi:MAG: hypothetical protein C0505_06220 [Leptothrix sp. (in: Bacteria)]|nr:hypothetical protein [Leptothrix sp. (in: b-proteobacteria)]